MKSQAFALITAAALYSVSHAGAAVSLLTSVDQIDFTNVVKAYDMTGSSSISSFGTTFDIGGVTFTRHNWQFSSADGLTMTGGHATADNQNSGAPNITLGGTAADRTNLNILLDVWNIHQGNSNGSQLGMSIALANGTYKVQYLVGMNNDRGNDLFDVTAGGIGSGNEVLIDSFEQSSNSSANYLITGNVTVTSGTLDLVLVGDNAAGDARPIISGLIISQIPEPSSALMSLLGLMVLMRRRR